MSTRRRFVPLAALIVSATSAFAQAPAYHVSARYTVGGEGGWDYLTVDAAAHRLYVSHATHVQVLSLDSGTVVGDIANTPGVHGIALAPDLKRGFVSSGRDSSVTIFDLRTLATISRINVGARNPDAIVYDAVSSVTAVHEDAPDRYTVVQTIPTRRGARTIALDERTHRLYLPTAEFGPPPPPTTAQPRPRPTIVPGSFMVLVLER